MYKTKLQELCHQKRWALPKYSAMRDGPDHLPRFKASVFVNGANFDSLSPCNSSKEAHNEAAKLAFDHFSSSQSSPDSGIAETIAKEQRTGAYEPQELPISADSSIIKDDFNGLYKNQLQNYTRRKNLGSPIFTSKSEGPPHSTRFKAMVIIDGQSFESTEFFNTLREAEKAAAKVALMSLSLDIFQKGDSSVYKNLLQEFAQREGRCKPTYKTRKSGSPQSPSFFSTVEVEGKQFHGKAEKSKKQAEQDAAKVAYISLKGGGSNLNATFSPSDFIKTEALKSIHCSQQPEEDVLSNKNSSTSESRPASPKQYPSSSFSELDLSARSIPEPNKAMTPEASSYLLCNRFRVYTSFPDIAFPEGITVLPVSDNKWVAVSLEFPTAEVHC
ncbi:hypothetical protein L6164_031421 [Bauhinia variegata]|uniref:Uncharacterized protein n=1 Tax=Bauhinia variegata TaxID=167791 RepID=A0ACB9LFV1_BAUVA|nr:hypothetical protein L6164_031421 [Bauhinia variegata]